MRKLLLAPALVGSLVLGAQNAQAHCDAIGGPVASAAISALESRNVNLALPYVPAAAEAEVGAAFHQALAVRAAGGDAKALADRFFTETVVRLHRAGEGAPYTGLKPAGSDFGPAIPAAERALESGDAAQLEALLVEEVRHTVRERFAAAKAAQKAAREPRAGDGVPAARERVDAELGFVRFAEGLHLATRAEGHREE